MQHWIDLTQEVGPDLPIYAEADYRDPPFEARPWSRIAENGFEVWQLSLGTQTGTHIDAPRHFLEGGASLETLPMDACTGPYHYVSKEELGTETAGCSYSGERILFLDAHPELTVSNATLTRLIALPPLVWIMAGALTIGDPDPFRLNRALAEAGKFLVEDLDPQHVSKVPVRGEAIVMPLRLMNVSGSPVRLLVRAVP
ncbi:MAG: cyclase family protein [Pseudomonadota bacterium]